MTQFRVLKRLFGYVFPTVVLRLGSCLLAAAQVGRRHPKITGLEVGQDSKKRLLVGFPSCCCSFFLFFFLEGGSQLLTQNQFFTKMVSDVTPREQLGSFVPLFGGRLW